MKMKLDLRVLKGYHEKIVFGANALFQIKLSFKLRLSSNHDQHFRGISCGTIIHIRLRHTP